MCQFAKAKNVFDKPDNKQMITWFTYSSNALRDEACQ